MTRLIDFWRERFEYHQSKHTDKRRGCVNARLNDGYSESQLMRVLERAAGEPFWRGQNDRQTPYDDIAVLFLNAQRVDQFLAKDRLQLKQGAAFVDRTRADLAVSEAPLTEERI